MLAAATAQLGILCYPGAQLSAIHGLADLFETATRLASERGGQVPELRPLRIEPGLATPDVPAEPLAALILPPSLGGVPSREAVADLLPWLLARHREGSVLCSVCAGAFVLAETGLLDGHPATTHWALADAFTARFARVKLDCARLLIDDGALITAGGVMSWVDLGLRLVDRLLGPAAMLATARMFVVDPAGREQSYYASLAPRLAHGDGPVLRAQQWLAAHFSGEVSMAQLAALAGLGERTFLRRFQAATGQKPSAYLQQLRVAQAKEMLELGERPVDEIAWQVGYQDASAFRKIFHRLVGLAPGAYRQRFAVARRAYPRLRQQAIGIAAGD